MQNHSYDNDFDLHENETAFRTHFHMKGFALRLFLKQRLERTRKWSINYSDKENSRRSGGKVYFVKIGPKSFGDGHQGICKDKECNSGPVAGY